MKRGRKRTLKKIKKHHQNTVQVFTKPVPSDYIISKQSIQQRMKQFRQRGRQIAAVYKSPLQHPFETQEVDV